MTDAYREASKYETARKRELRRHHEAKDRERENHLERMKALRAALSPAAARIVVAAEGVVDVGEPEDFTEQEPIPLLTEDPNPAPAWLNQEPAPLPAGALLEVAEKPARRRA